MLTSIKPKTLLKFALVCKNWYENLRKDEFWYKARNKALAEYFMLGPLFTQKTPIWHVFCKRIYPFIRNINMTCTRIFDYNTHLTSALVYAHCKQYGEIKELSIRRPMGFIASSFGGVHATFYDYPGEFMTFTFTAIDRDYKLEKKLGIKRRKTEKVQPYVRCFFSRRNREGIVIERREMTLADLFKPFVQAVL